MTITHAKLTSIVNRFAPVTEELDGGVSPDTELAGHVTLHSGVHLRQLNGGFIFFQGFGRLDVLRGQGLAVSAPWGI